MRRKSFDVIVGVGGSPLTVALGGRRRLALLGLQLCQEVSSVSNQLSGQRITFPAATAFAQAKPGTEITLWMIPYLEKYAGQEMTTGAQAQAYANHFIAVHLQQIGKGKTYSELSGAAQRPKGSAAFTSAEATVQTVFQGTTLRSMLPNADGWWQMGQIALIAVHRELRLGRRDPALVGPRVLAPRRVPAKEEYPELRDRHHHPEAGSQLPLDRSLGQIRPLRTEPRSGINTSRGAGVPGLDLPGKSLLTLPIGDDSTGPHPKFDQVKSQDFRPYLYLVSGANMDVKSICRLWEISTMVVYESMFGATRVIAEAIVNGFSVYDQTMVVRVSEVGGSVLYDVDLVVVGSPTHVRSMSRPSTRKAAPGYAKEHGGDLALEPGVDDAAGVREWLGHLGRHTIFAAAFDTRGRGPAALTGRASKAIN